MPPPEEHDVPIFDASDEELLDSPVPVSEPAPQPEPLPTRTAPFREAPSRRTDKPKRRRDEDSTLQASPAGRELPSSAEAEEHVIACCLIDGSETIDRCLEARIKPDAFHFPAARQLYEIIVEMRQSGATVMIETLAEELKKRRLLAAVGGFPYLMQVTGKIPTTAHAGYFIEVLREKHLLRELIRAATGAVEKAYAATGLQDVESLYSQLGKQVEKYDEVISPIDDLAKPITAFTYPAANDPSVLLGTRYRYLCRGGSMLIVGPAGVGKSTTTYQAAASWGLGRPFLGIDCAKPMEGLRCLVVQGEDDDGDIGEVWESIKQGMQLTPEELARLNRNVRIVRDKVNTNEAFIVALRSYVRQFKPDLVFINPLMAYCSGLGKEEIAGPFLYGGLNGVNAEQKFAYVVLHHTPKPPAPANGKGAKKGEFDHQYSGFGSSVLSNWPRAIVIIEAQRDNPGQFIFRLAKRGKRAGVTEIRDIGNGIKEYHAVTQIPVQHSQGRVKVGNRELPMILWEVSKATTTAAPEGGSDSTQSRKKPRKHARSEVVGLFPVGIENRIPLRQITKLAADTLLLKEATFMDWRHELVQDGVVIRAEDGRYYRPEL